MKIDMSRANQTECKECRVQLDGWSAGCTRCYRRWHGRLRRGNITRDEFNAKKPAETKTMKSSVLLTPEELERGSTALQQWITARRRRIEHNQKIYLKTPPRKRHKAMLEAFTEKQDRIYGTNGELTGAILSLTCKHCAWEKTITPSFNRPETKPFVENKEFEQAAKNHWETTHANEWALEVINR